MKSFLGVCGLVVVAVVSMSLTRRGDDGSKFFDKTFMVENGGTLTLETITGNIRITGTDENTVSVVVNTGARSKNLENFEVTAEKTASGVSIRGAEIRKMIFNNWNLDIEFIIRVPKKYNLDLQTSGGNIDVQKLVGAIQGGTSGGNLILKSIDGPVNLKTSGGNVLVENGQGSLRLKTSGGNMEIANFAGDADASTSGGNIVISNSKGKISAETSGGNIRAEVVGNFKGVNVETSGGDIDIKLPADIKATLQAYSTGGDVECDFPILVTGGKMRDNKINGDINGGGELIKARTSGGEIRITKQ